MSSLTRDGIAYNLNISPHKADVLYEDETLTFVFSSALYRDKFIAAQKDNREKINNSLSNRFGFTCINSKLCDIKLYSTIEKRGFLIYKGLVKFVCREDIILDGNKLMKKS